MRNKFSIIIGIFILSVFIYDWLREPFIYAPDKWNKVILNDVSKIEILPLLYSFHDSCFTINTDIIITDNKIKKQIFDHMRGKYEWAADKWGANRQIRVFFYLKSGEIIPFEVSFHSKIEMASYYYLKNPNDVRRIANLAHKGGKLISKILKEQIRNSEVRWVNSSYRYWDVNSGTDLVFKGVPEADKKEWDVQETAVFRD